MDDAIASAILQTLTYADLFDYAITPDEIFRFLINVRATRSEVDGVLNDHSRLNGTVACVDACFTLPRRQALVADRARLHEAAE